jgi:cytochrome c553
MSALPVLAADGKDIVASGTPGRAASCSPCHGQNGQGQPATGVPRLAGLNAQYLERQLESFKDGTRKNRIMLMIASDLSDDDKKALANYYAGVTTPKSETAPADAALIAAGAKLAATGDWSKDLPGCGQCHGAAGLGVGTDFPRLAGQWAVYIEKALRSWKAGDRKNDPMGVMANVANNLTDDQIKSVAAYYESLPVAAPAKSPETKP